MLHGTDPAPDPIFKAQAPGLEGSEADFLWHSANTGTKHMQMNKEEAGTPDCWPATRRGLPLHPLGRWPLGISILAIAFILHVVGDEETDRSDVEKNPRSSLTETLRIPFKV
jgi:hypothetical protein